MMMIMCMLRCCVSEPWQSAKRAFQPRKFVRFPINITQFSFSTVVALALHLRGSATLIEVIRLKTQSTRLYEAGCYEVAERVLRWYVAVAFVVLHA